MHMNILALVVASFLLSLGGPGAAASFFQHNPNEFMTELRTYLSANIDTTELASLDDSTPESTDTVTPSPNPAANEATEKNETQREEEHKSSVSVNAGVNLESRFDD